MSRQSHWTSAHLHPEALELGLQFVDARRALNLSSMRQVEQSLASMYRLATDHLGRWAA
jgi:hypothetical protein